jgi:hypothetical protein
MGCAALGMDRCDVGVALGMPLVKLIRMAIVRVAYAFALVIADFALHPSKSWRRFTTAKPVIQ